MMTKRVLHVEDDRQLRGLVEFTLLEAGFAMDSVADGLAAMDRLSDRTSRYDVVVLDLVMPRMNGFEVLAALRAAPATRALPVLVTTGSLVSPRDFSGDERTYLLPKPFTSEQLVGAVTAIACGQPRN
jgi:DNA-binding response OmpR family regulator